MRIIVVVKTGKRHTTCKKLHDGRYEISVIEIPEHGKANDAVRRALADTLGIAPSRLSLVMGATARTKVFEVR